jgi:hypothetical protein
VKGALEFSWMAGTSSALTAEGPTNEDWREKNTDVIFLYRRFMLTQ